MTDDGFDRALDGASASIVDERVASAFDGCRLPDDFRRAARPIVEENLRLKSDLFKAQGMLKRVYAMLDRLTDSPAFRAMMDTIGEDGDGESNG